MAFRKRNPHVKVDKLYFLKVMLQCILLFVNLSFLFDSVYFEFGTFRKGNFIKTNLLV